jgi:drug/metabolite transporter (DMT)-like permease
MLFFFAILSGLFYTGQGLLTRYLLKGNKDAWAFSFYFSFVGALVSLPFMLANLKVANSVSAWSLIILIGFLIVAQNLLSFKSSNFIEASITGTISKFRLVWVFILEVIIFKEIFSLNKLLGVLLSVLAGVIIIQGIKKPKSIKGVLLALSATIFYAIVIMFYKILFTSFNSQSLTFFIFAIPALLNFLIMPQAPQRIYNLIKENGKVVLLACSLGAFANLAMNHSLSIGDATKTLVIIESFLIVALVGEHFFLKEKSHVVIKLLAVIFAITGAVLIRLS